MHLFPNQVPFLAEDRALQKVNGKEEQLVKRQLTIPLSSPASLMHTHAHISKPPTLLFDWDQSICGEESSGLSFLLLFKNNHLQCGPGLRD